MAVEIFDNINSIVKDDFEKTMKEGSKVSIAAACFSMYAYKELKKELESLNEFRFLFTSPTFVTDKGKKEKREFYIPKLGRERSLYGTEFEVKLKNEMTQSAIAKECAEWIKKKAKFKSNTTSSAMGGFVVVENEEDKYVYQPFNEFTTSGIGCDLGNNAYNIVTRIDAPESEKFLKVFDDIWNDKDKLQDVTDIVIGNMQSAYAENSPELIYYITLYNVFNEFLDDISEDVIPNEATGFKKSKIWNMLYDFQKDAALGIINKLEKYNGCILADSVGLGKTFTALAVIKYYENRNKSVLVLCPKKLADNWNTYKDNYVNNPIASDRLNYTVLFHTDLSRHHGYSNGIDLGRINWGNYDLVVIDESHNFRNGYGTHSNTQENRYSVLMDRIIRSGVKTKVLMLSATPVNNRFSDLKNQLALAYEGNPELINDKLDTKRSIDDIFKQAQRAFRRWSELPENERTTERLQQSLDFDFFELLDSVTIARSRKHIEKYYNTSALGRFPDRLKPISLRPSLTDLSDATNYKEIYEELLKLNLEVYVPSAYIFESKKEKYEKQDDSDSNMSQAGREEGIRRLMRIGLMKRFESSVHSFRLTLTRILGFIESTVKTINEYSSRTAGNGNLEILESAIDNDLDIDEQNEDLFTVGKKVQINLADMDYISWKNSLEEDVKIIRHILALISDITPEHDAKLIKLTEMLGNKIEHPINEGNKKVLIFSAYSDTVEYLYNNLSGFIKERYGLESAMVTGSIDGKTTIKGLKASFNNILTCFSPESKDMAALMPGNDRVIDILFASDCISEGQNLQDCDYCINYDIHWNPVRIIQRFGRIDRIGSRNSVIQLVNFWPDMDLDEYIKLKGRVETRMKATVLTSTGDDDLINPEEKGDLEYRSAQLKKLHEEVVDIEDMKSGVSIMDLGLNDFRMDLMEYIKSHSDIEKKPFGLHAVAPANDEMPEGVIFVLKNRNNGVNIDSLNRIHPFYMVYISMDGEVICDYLNPKKLLDDMRLICRGKSEPDMALCSKFNKITKDGTNMSGMSELLSDAIDSIINRKETSDIESLFKAGGTSALMSEVSGLDDFELVTFLAVMKEG